MTNPVWTRRRMLAAALAGVTAWPVAGFASETSLAGASAGRMVGARFLELLNLHTNEIVSVAFRDATGYIASALSQLNHLLRDHRTGERHEIDPALFDQLNDLALAAGREPRFEIISGYRSPATNEKLRKTGGGGVAKRSLHMEGRALDIRLKGCDCARLRDLAIEAKRGGVGYYKRSNFVHIDTGRVRFWAG